MLTPRLDNGKANLSIKHFNDHLKQLNVEIMANTNITPNDLGKKGLHLSKGGKGKLASNIVNALKVDLENWRVSCPLFSLDSLKNKHKKNVLFGYINVYSIRNKLPNLFNEIRDNFNIFSIAETKLYSSFPNAQFLNPSYKTPYRLDISNTSGGIMVYIKKRVSLAWYSKGYPNCPCRNLIKKYVVAHYIYL